MTFVAIIGGQMLKHSFYCSTAEPHIDGTTDQTEFLTRKYDSSYFWPWNQLFVPVLFSFTLTKLNGYFDGQMSKYVTSTAIYMDLEIRRIVWSSVVPFFALMSVIYSTFSAVTSESDISLWLWNLLCAINRN